MHCSEPRPTAIPLSPTKVSSIMKLADIGFAVLILFGLSAGVFWLSVHGWWVPQNEHRRDW
jgi:hypothetical protein